MCVEYAGTPRRSIDSISNNISFRLLILNKNFYIPNLIELENTYKALEASLVCTGKGSNNIKGKALEKFVTQLFEYCPAFKCSPDIRTKSNQIDVKINIVPTIIDHPFIKSFGSVFLAECKNTEDKIDSRIIENVNALLEDFKCKFGIVISRNGITGDSKYEDGNARRIKIYYRYEGRVILVITFKQIKELIIDQKLSLITLLEEEYNKFVDSI